MKSTKLLFAVLAAALSSLVFTGCNTINGAGKDIEKAGDKIQDAANKNR